MLAIIGGSGLAQLPILEITHRQVVRTPYGEASCALTFGRLGKQNVVFVARHGHGHSLAPHEINYRANIWALHDQGVKGIVSIGSVGGIRSDMVPGSLVIPESLIDYTWGRKHTFFEGPDQPVVHVDFTVPYEAELRQKLIEAAGHVSCNVIAGGVYGCTQGPRLETVAEVARLERDGVDIVGMTGMPEASLARELNIPYAHLCFVSNWAAGKQSATEVVFEPSVLESSVQSVTEMLQQFFSA